MNKLWCIHTVKYYLAIKKNEVLIPTRRVKRNWITLKQKATYCVILFQRHSGKGKPKRTENRSKLPEAGGGGEGYTYKEPAQGLHCSVWWQITRLYLSNPTELYMPQKLHFNICKFKHLPGCVWADRMQSITDESNYITNEPHHHTEEIAREEKN